MPELDHLFEQRDLVFKVPEELADPLDVDTTVVQSCGALQVSHDFFDVPGPARVFNSGGQESIHERGHLAGRFARAFVLELRLPELGVTLLGRLGHAVADRLDQEREPEWCRVFQAGLRLLEILVALFALAGLGLEDRPCGPGKNIGCGSQAAVARRP